MGKVNLCKKLPKFHRNEYRGAELVLICRKKIDRKSRDSVPLIKRGVQFTESQALKSNMVYMHDPYIVNV
jgi:hypothetical protein